MSLFGATLEVVLAPALDALMISFHTTQPSIFFMSAVRTTMRKVVVVAHTCFMLVETCEAFEGFWDFDTIWLCLALGIGLWLGPRLSGL